MFDELMRAIAVDARPCMPAMMGGVVTRQDALDPEVQYTKIWAHLQACARCRKTARKVTEVLAAGLATLPSP